MEKFIAIYGYQKTGYEREFDAANKEDAIRLAKEFEAKENKGEAKSDRIRFIKVVTKTITS
jgi:hypothetical protein